MKAIALSAVACIASNGVAQQLPNVGFEEEWVECYPWSSVFGGENTYLSMKAAAAIMGQQIEGLQPKDWTVSDVLGVVSPIDEEDGGGYGALGVTEVAFKVDGYNSATALKLQNNPNPFMAAQIVPGYVSLGTTWATNTLDLMTFSVTNKDGGVFGGIEFNARPDALVFDYMREYGEEKLDQVATVLVYAWKGEWQQADVPGNNSMSSETVKVTMIDRDRNVLGMPTSQGGEVTHSDDAELIAKGLQYIESMDAEWTSYLLPIEYFSDATPEKLNVVIAANDYFDSQTIVNGNSLTVDNIKLVYYSRLSDLKINGKAINGFSSDRFTYIVTGNMPAEDEIEATLLGQGKTASVTTSVEDNVLTVKVENSVGEDVDGENTHVYTITFTGEEGEAYSGYLNIVMNGGTLAQDEPATIIITNTDENHCIMTLPNFAIDLGSGMTPLGDIVVPDVEMTQEEGRTHYVGAVEGMSLLGGAFVADVNVDGYIYSNGNVNMQINVMWNGIPIDVTFTSSTSAVSNIVIDNQNAPVEFYNLNGVRLNGDNLPAGIYIRRQGTEVSKILVK